MNKAIPVLASLSLLVVACSSSSTSIGKSDGGADAGSSDAATDAATVPHETDGAACPATLDAFKPCVTPADCTVAVVPGCCGVPDYVGIATSASADYASCFPKADCSGLGCASSSDCKAEDGNTGHCQSGTDVLGATCTAGRCQSYVKGDAGADGG